jgi:hypothetical protein
MGDRISGVARSFPYNVTYNSSVSTGTRPRTEESSKFCWISSKASRQTLELTQPPIEWRYTSTSTYTVITCTQKTLCLPLTSIKHISLHTVEKDSIRAGRSGDRIPVRREFQRPSRPALRPTQQPVRWVPGSGIDHPPLPKAEVKERVELNVYSPSGPSWRVIGRIFPLLLLPKNMFDVPPDTVPLPRIKRVCTRRSA